MDSQKLLFKMCFVLPSSPKSCTVPQPGRAFAWRTIEIDLMRFFDAVNTMDILLMTSDYRRLVCWSWSQTIQTFTWQRTTRAPPSATWQNGYQLQSTSPPPQQTIDEKIHASSFIVRMLVKDSFLTFLSTFFYFYMLTRCNMSTLFIH